MRSLASLALIVPTSHRYVSYVEKVLWTLLVLLAWPVTFYTAWVSMVSACFWIDKKLGPAPPPARRSSRPPPV